MKAHDDFALWAYAMGFLTGGLFGFVLTFWLFEQGLLP